MSYYTICEQILEWAKYREYFDTTFIESVMEFYDKSGFFTPHQQIAIDNIVKKWNISINEF